MAKVPFRKEQILIGHYSPFKKNPSFQEITQNEEENRA
jgi:hypothetical protein